MIYDPIKIREELGIAGMMNPYQLPHEMKINDIDPAYY